MSRFGKFLIPAFLFIVALRVLSGSFAVSVFADVFEAGHAQLSQVTDLSTPIGSDATVIDAFASSELLI